MIRGNAGEHLRGTPITNKLKEEFPDFSFQNLKETFNPCLITV